MPIRTHSAPAQLTTVTAVAGFVTAGPPGVTVPPAGSRPPGAGQEVPSAEHKPFTPSCYTPCCVIDINKHNPTLQLI